jgi:hypothetical protein
MPVMYEALPEVARSTLIFFHKPMKFKDYLMCLIFGQRTKIGQISGVESSLNEVAHNFIHSLCV